MTAVGKAKEVPEGFSLLAVILTAEIVGYWTVPMQTALILYAFARVWPRNSRSSCLVIGKSWEIRYTVCIQENPRIDSTDHLSVMWTVITLQHVSGLGWLEGPTEKFLFQKLQLACVWRIPLGILIVLEVLYVGCNYFRRTSLSNISRSHTELHTTAYLM